jgi:hypothetical protein
MNPYSLEEAKQILETSLREAREMIADLISMNIEKLSAREKDGFKEVVDIRIGLVAEGLDFIKNLQCRYLNNNDFDNLSTGYSDALRQLQMIRSKTR